jgi:hypothetical protein
MGLFKQAKVKTIIGDLLLELNDGSVTATNGSFEQSKIACGCVATVAGSGP